jgi:S-formylglutathione hydrolase FrmB
MGGYGAFKLGLNYPEKFGAVASLSGSVDMCMVAKNSAYRSKKAIMFRNITFGTEEEMQGSEMDTVFLAEQHLKNGTVLPKFYQCCGTEDWLLPVNRSFKDRFINRLDLTYEEGPGGHNWEFWDQYIQKVLKWLPIKR